ncbi:GNAT family N-acetyltransferase [Streptomyces sp. NPDC094437]|uniref:GNAT family N-acetyltransferase n=1 Tax=Streptomyces sp. NPDC094437 TaxID=3366060 RepID=UPI00380912E4
MTAAVPEDLVVTRATPDDWRTVVDWAGAEGWNPGLADASAFFTLDPDGFFVGRLDGEIVSSICVLNHSADFAFLGLYLVRADLRGHGCGLTTWKTALSHAGSRTVGLEGVVAQQDNYRRSGFRFAHRTDRFTGLAPATEVPADVRAVREGDFAELLAYDGACSPADRPRFLTAWLTSPGHRALVRRAGGRVTGYGVVRPGPDALRIGPLFADTADDARALFAGLVAEVPGEEIAVDVPATNAAAVALARQAGLTPSFEMARMYTGPVRPFAEERVFAYTTVEVG